MEIPYSRYIIGNIPWYSVLIVSGIVLAVILGQIEAVRRGLPRDTAVDVALFGIPMGIIGARLYYVVFSWEQYASNPVSVLYIWEGGIAIYGCILGGILGILLCAKVRKYHIGDLLDVAAPGLILAQAIGRWGNYFNMEAYGPVITDTRFCFFPVGVLINGNEWHYATFFYESCWNLGVFLLVWFALRKKITRRGHLAAWELILYGCGRFVVEQLRTDSLYIGSLRASQWLALVMCLLLAAFLLYRRKGKWWILCLALLAVKWFLLRQPVLYVVTIVLAYALLLEYGRKARGITAAIFAVDLIGWLCALLQVPVSASLAYYVHALACTATYALAVAMLYFCGEEGTKCRLEENAI